MVAVPSGANLVTRDDGLSLLETHKFPLGSTTDWLGKFASDGLELGTNTDVVDVALLAVSPIRAMHDKTSTATKDLAMVEPEKRILCILMTL